jgi:hypothetical protein
MFTLCDGRDTDVCDFCNNSTAIGEKLPDHHVFSHMTGFDGKLGGEVASLRSRRLDLPISHSSQSACR